MINGTPRFSALAVGDLTASFRGGGQTLSCRAAFVDNERGITCGWTKGEGAIWSPETILRLKALRDSMETDLAAIHFTNATQHVPTNGRPVELDGLGGLGEYLDEADQA